MQWSPADYVKTTMCMGISTELLDELNRIRFKKITKRTVTFDCLQCGKEKNPKWKLNEIKEIKCRDCHTMNKFLVQQAGPIVISEINDDFSYYKGKYKQECIDDIEGYKDEHERRLMDVAEDSSPYHHEIAYLLDLIQEKEEELSDIEQYTFSNQKHNVTLLDAMLQKKYRNRNDCSRINVKASKVTKETRYRSDGVMFTYSPRMYYKCPFCNGDHCHGAWQLGENIRSTQCGLILPNNQRNPSVIITIDENTPGYSS